MFEKVKALRDRFRIAETTEEENQIQRELDALRIENPDEWAEAMLLCMKDTNRELKELLVREKLEKILPYISVAQLVKEYFKKTPQWFYQRVNNNIVNGKPAQFNEEELKTLNFALKDIAKKIGSVSV